MKKFIWILMMFILLACTPVAFAWDEGGWDNQKVPYIRQTAAPGVTDDDYPVPFVWINETTDKAYLLVDNSTGAAVWREVMYTGATPSFVTVDLTGITDGNLPYMQAAGAGFGDSPLSRADANTVTLQAATGQAATLNLIADAGEDNADKYRVSVADSGAITIESYQSGAWVAIVTTDNLGNVTTTTLNTARSATPGITGRDSDGTDPDDNGIMYWDLSATGSGLEYTNWYLRMQGAQGTAGTMETALWYNSQAQTLYPVVDGDVDMSSTNTNKLILASNVGLTADTGSSQGDGAIISTYNVYTTVGTAGDCATLPATAKVGTLVVIKNDAAANAMDIFPASGDDLGEGADTALSLAAGKGAMFICTVADSTWTNILEGI
jgi:hypothetical protein